MLTSLFGDLGPRDRVARTHTDFEATEVDDNGFAATAIMESVATEVNERGQIIDRHVSDLVVTGSPAQAIREHFAATRSDLDTATSLITMLDPAGVWAAVGHQGACRMQAGDRSSGCTCASTGHAAHARDDRAHDAGTPP